MSRTRPEPVVPTPAAATLAWRILQVALLLLLAALSASHVRGQSPPTPVRMNEVTQASLLWKTSSPGAFLPAPSVETDVRIRVTGMIARGQVSQRFHNATGACAEGIYVFPLPEDAAVDQLWMTIGGRTIEAEIRERHDAKQVYEQARSEGRKASLLEQERPNVFTMSVAGIGPDEDVRVDVVYQQALRYDQGRFRFRFPTVVGPRYVPGSPLATDGTAPTGTGWSPDTDAVPDASRITPPVPPPDAAGKLNPIHVTLDLDAGFPLRDVSSGTHSLHAAVLHGSRYSVNLSDEPVFADRDLEVSWALDLGHEPKAAIFTQERTGEAFALVMVVPPANEAAPGVRLPRETVFVIDTSGSMHGTSIDGARRALTLALKRLDPEDRFNVVEFNSVTRRLFPDCRRALPAEVDAAVRWVSRLEAHGGTEMLPALASALEGASGEESVRQVLFMTDGGVSNEETLFRFIREHLGNSRLFTVGLGSAPNSHFMTKAAEFGRGTFTFIASPAEVETKMADLFRKLESPVLTNLEVQFDDPSAEMWPAKLPDVYAGEPLILAVRLASSRGTVTIGGRRADGPWSTRLMFSAGSPDSGVHRLWASRKIAAMMDALTAGSDGPTRDGVRAQVLPVALAHHLVTEFTSLVAVDITPAGQPGQTQQGQACVARPIPVNLPDGWSYEHVFGEMPRTATPGTLCLLLGAGLIGFGLLFVLVHARGRARAHARLDSDFHFRGGTGAAS